MAKKSLKDCSANMMTQAPRWTFLIVIACLSGCSHQPATLPVTGKVLHNGKPLAFGLVMLQPVTGQMSQAQIQADGTFRLATFEPDDGAPVGNYRVSVLCYEAHDPKGPGPQENEGGGMMLGKSLIPLKYSRASSSGLTAQITPDGPNELLFELSGSPPR